MFTWTSESDGPFNPNQVGRQLRGFLWAGDAMSRLVLRRDLGAQKNSCLHRDAASSWAAGPLSRLHCHNGSGRGRTCTVHGITAHRTVLRPLLSCGHHGGDRGWLANLAPLLKGWPLTRQTVRFRPQSQRTQEWSSCPQKRMN